jgi:hypothetical protein
MHGTIVGDVAAKHGESGAIVTASTLLQVGILHYDYKLGYVKRYFVF